MPSHYPEPEPLFSQYCPLQLRTVHSPADFKFLKVIGQGPLTRVYLAKHVATGFKVAIKAYYKKLMKSKDAKQVLREAELHLDCHHENIIDLYLALFDDNAIYLVMELAERSDLFKEMQRFEKGRMPEDTAAEYVMHPLLRALKFMHNRGIAHRDVKPENILFTVDKTLKLCDLGLSIDMTMQKPTTRLGTLVYSAPEVLTAPERLDSNNEREGYTESCDAWSVGCLLHELLCGDPPFQRETQLETFSAIVEEEYMPPPYLSPDVQDFLRLALQKEADARPSMDDLLAHPWIKRLRRKESAARVFLSDADDLSHPMGSTAVSLSPSALVPDSATAKAPLPVGTLHDAPSLDPLEESMTGRLKQANLMAARQSDPSSHAKIHHGSHPRAPPHVIEKFERTSAPIASLASGSNHGHKHPLSHPQQNHQTHGHKSVGTVLPVSTPEDKVDGSEPSQCRSCSGKGGSPDGLHLHRRSPKDGAPVQQLPPAVHQREMRASMEHSPGPGVQGKSRFAPRPPTDGSSDASTTAEAKLPTLKPTLSAQAAWLKPGRDGVHSPPPDPEKIAQSKSTGFRMGRRKSKVAALSAELDAAPSPRPSETVPRGSTKGEGVGCLAFLSRLFS